MAQYINLEIVDEVKWIASAGATPETVTEIRLDGTKIWPIPVILGSGDLVLKVIHAEYCELNEAGTEAYFSTTQGNSNSPEVVRYSDSSHTQPTSGTDPDTNPNNVFSKGAILVHGTSANGIGEPFILDKKPGSSNFLGTGNPKYGIGSSTNKGRVRTYDMTPGVMRLQGSNPDERLVSSGSSQNRNFGTNVAFNWNSTGANIVVGSVYSGNKEGEVHLIEYTDTGAIQYLSSRIQGPQGNSYDELHIVDIAQTGDSSNIVAVGGDGVDNVKVYDVSTSFVQKGSAITGADNFFGRSLALDSTGNVLFLKDSSNQILVYSYSSDWTLNQTITMPSNSITSPFFGGSLDVVKKGDGKHTLAVGCTGTDGGFIYVYTEDNSGQYQLTLTIFEPQNQFGKQVRLSKDGESRVATIDQDKYGYVYNL